MIIEVDRDYLLTHTHDAANDDVCVTGINMPVVGVHAAQQSSKLALEGQYTPSRLNAFMYQRLVARTSYVVSFVHCKHMKIMNSRLHFIFLMLVGFLFFLIFLLSGVI